MAKGFKHGGGGADLLNFKVVGNPQPEVAKENTIWIDTDAPITGWIFSLTEPAQPREGMVWILTGKSSVAQFNALKKNALQVYPMQAKQYISGSWVLKSSALYQVEGWQALWDGTLYDKGNHYVEITGGWEMYGYILNGTSALEKNWCSFNSNSITLGGNAFTEFFCGTRKAVDLTQYESIEIHVLAEGTSYSSTGRVYVAKLSDPKTPIARMDINVGSNVMDIVSLEGEYIVGVSMYNYNWENTMEFDFVKLN